MKRRFAYYAIRDGNYKMHVSTWPMAWDIIEERRKRGGNPNWKGCYNLMQVKEFLEKGEKQRYDDLLEAYINSNGKNKAFERELVRRAAMKF